jgi:hypothetical protein
MYRRNCFCRHTREGGYPESLILKNTGFPIKTSGMTNRDFCKSLSGENIFN